MVRRPLGEDSITEVMKALGDPARWSIVSQVAAAGELPCATLEDTLPLSKPTISYHAKILQHAGLLRVRKQGRNYFYSLDLGVLREAVGELLAILPAPDAPVSLPARRRRPPASRRSSSARDVAAGAEELSVLTW